MALREFRDDQGRQWRAWDIVPDQLHPTTRLEDYMQGFLDGWLAFETTDGAERARLSPVPVGWADGGEEELRALLARAERAGTRGRPPSTGPDAARARPSRRAVGEAESGSPESARSETGGSERDTWSGSWPALPAERGMSAPPGTIRTFRYPGGRFWSVFEHVVELPAPGAPGALRPRVVLRFASGMRSLDLLAWPADWHLHDDEGLAELLWRAFPRDPAASTTGSLRRRRSDRPAHA